MSDYVVIAGDQALFDPSFGAATVTVRPGILRATGPATRGGKGMCIDGDERSVSVPGCSYVTPSYPIPGLGTLEIASLASDQIAGKTRSGQTSLILVGSRFLARFVVQVPAQQPTSAGPVPDPAPRYSGTGTFQTTNSTFRGA
jgi:hypothetical protein